MLFDGPVARLVRQGVEGVAAVRAHTVVDLDRLEPVIEAGLRGTRAVAGPFRGRLVKAPVGERMRVAAQRRITVRRFGHLEVLADDVIEVVVARPFHRGIVASTEILDAIGFRYGFVCARHVIRHDVDDDFHAVVVGALDQRLEFLEPLCRVHGEVRVDAVVVLDGIRRAGTPLYDVGVVGAYAEVRVVADHGMMRHAGIPDMADAQFADAFQRRVGEVVELANAIFLDGSPGLVRLDLVTEQSREYLVNHGFAHA